MFLEISQNSQENTYAMSLWHRCFPINFAKFLRTPIFILSITQEVRNVSFSENFAYVLNGWPQSLTNVP